MRKRKSRTNPFKHFKMSSLRNVKTPEAWIKKESYTDEELNQQREANRILNIWDSTKDPDIVKRRTAYLTITCPEISGHAKKAKMDTPFKIDLARNYINCLKCLYGVNKAPKGCTFKDAFAVIARAVKGKKYRIFGTDGWNYQSYSKDMLDSQLLEYFSKELCEIRQKEIAYVVKACLAHWEGDNSLTTGDKEKLAKKYAKALYDWARAECDDRTFQAKSISETQAHLAKLLEDNKDYIEGKRIKGVN